MGSGSPSIRPTTRLRMILAGTLLVIGGPFTRPVAAVIQPQNPRPYKIWVSVEEQREEQFLQSIRKLRDQEERLGQFLEKLRAEGVDMDDPHLLMIYREMRDLRRRIWRLERERFR